MPQLEIKKAGQRLRFTGKNYEHLWLQLEDLSQGILDPQANDYDKALAQALDKDYKDLSLTDCLENTLSEAQIKDLILTTLPSYGYQIIKLDK